MTGNVEREHNTKLVGGNSNQGGIWENMNWLWIISRYKIGGGVESNGNEGRNQAKEEQLHSRDTSQFGRIIGFIVEKQKVWGGGIELGMEIWLAPDWGEKNRKWRAQL